jgi:serine/threonine protein kinase
MQRARSVPGDCRYERKRTLAVTDMCPRDIARRADAWNIADFIVDKRLGSGASSEVYRARIPGCEPPFALKAYKKHAMSALNRHQVRREISIHSGLRHDHVVDFWGAFEDEDRIMLLMELANEDLVDHVNRRGGRLSERTVANMMRQIVSGVKYLHEQNVAHRDLKPENVLVATDGTLKLADFGLSIDLTQERAVTCVGTPMFMAPEALACPKKRTPEENKDRGDLWYGAKVDCWACGAMAYEMLVGRSPFDAKRLSDIVHLVNHRDPAMPASVSEDARKFMQRALSKQAMFRPTAGRLMEFPFLSLKS